MAGGGGTLGGARYKGGARFGLTIKPATISPVPNASSGTPTARSASPGPPEQPSPLSTQPAAVRPPTTVVSAPVTSSVRESRSCGDAFAHPLNSKAAQPTAILCVSTREAYANEVRAPSDARTATR